MRIIKAEIEDTEIVVRILNASRLEYLPYAKSPHTFDESRQWVRKKLIPAGGVVIAQLDTEWVGVLATSVSNEIGWIDQLYIAPGYVGQGIGSELMAYAIGILPHPIRLWTFQENVGAIRFYETRGFSAIEYTNGENNEEQCPDVLYEYP